jgi:hypothetical protein
MRDVARSEQAVTPQAKPATRPAADAARRVSLCTWVMRCHEEGKHVAWYEGPPSVGIDRRVLCEDHLTAATALGYVEGEPPRDRAVDG